MHKAIFVLSVIFLSSSKLSAAESPICKNPTSAVYEHKFKEGKDYLEVTCPDGKKFIIEKLSDNSARKLILLSEESKNTNQVLKSENTLTIDQVDAESKETEHLVREKNSSDDLTESKVETELNIDPLFLLHSQNQIFEDWGIVQKE